jgi:hypothetical protein
MNWLSRFFHDGTGEPSMYRLVFFLTSLVILFVYLFKNIQAAKGVMVDFQPEQIKIFLIAVCGKVGQSGVETGIGNIISGIRGAIAPQSQGTGGA